MDMQTHLWLRLSAAALAFLASGAHFLLEPLRWNRCYLRDAQFDPLRQKIRDALFVTALATYLLPFKLGIPLRIVLLKRSAHIPAATSSLFIAADGGISLIVWCAGAAIAVWLAALSWHPPQLVWILLAAGILAGTVFALYPGAWRSKLAARLGPLTQLLSNGRAAVLAATGIVLADVVSYAIRHFFLIIAVLGGVEHAWVGAAIGVVATFAGIASGLPMGLIGYDATLVGLLSADGVSVEHAVSIALLNRAMNISTSMLLGFPAAFRLGLGSGFGAVIGHLRKLRDDRSQ